jgi:Xaa-Pro aminopeptidase
VLVTPGAWLRYLTGYKALPLERLTCLVLPAEGIPSLVVPSLEEPAAAASPAGSLSLKIRTWDETDDPMALAAGLVPGAARVGLDDQMWAEKVLRFQAVMPNAEQSLASSALTAMREVKDASEIALLREAAQAIDRVHERVPSWLHVGRTEREVGRDIADAIIAEGHVRVDFVIVASGPNGASPHHEIGSRVIEDGDVVVVDIGGTTEAGYCSDSTRMYVMGAVPADFSDKYDALLRAQKAAVARVRPGVSAESIDAAARDVLIDAGLGEYFIHRTGHGIGLESHEEPYIVTGNTREVVPGMVFSIEPGFYISGRFGARIEDIVVVTDDGVDRLNRSPRELIVI